MKNRLRTFLKYLLIFLIPFCISFSFFFGVYPVIQRNINENKIAIKIPKKYKATITKLAYFGKNAAVNNAPFAWCVPCKGSFCAVFSDGLANDLKVLIELC